MTLEPPRTAEQQSTFAPPARPATSPGGTPSPVPFIDSNKSKPIPPANTGNALLNWLVDLSTKIVHLERRFEPFFRPAFDAYAARSDRATRHGD